MYFQTKFSNDVLPTYLQAKNYIISIFGILVWSAFCVLCKMFNQQMNMLFLFILLYLLISLTVINSIELKSISHNTLIAINVSTNSSEDLVLVGRYSFIKFVTFLTLYRPIAKSAFCRRRLSTDSQLIGFLSPTIFFIT